MVTIPNGVFAEVILSNLTIRNGATVPSGSGGGIYSDVGRLTINGSTVTGNSAGTGGGIDSGGTLTINNSTITGNIADIPKDVAHGGGIESSGITTINNSTISGNSAVGGFFTLSFGGGIANDGTLMISRSNPQRE
jgi:hypothetical protein